MQDECKFQLSRKRTAEISNDLINFEEYAKKYDEKNFWEKLTRYATRIGKTTVEKALLLYYAAENPQTPVWAKTTIYGALAYLILPVDLIPDAIPVVGFADDATVIIAALAIVAVYIDDEVHAKATKKMSQWFDGDLKA